MGEKFINTAFLYIHGPNSKPDGRREGGRGGGGQPGNRTGPGCGVPKRVIRHDRTRGNFRAETRGGGMMPLYTVEDYGEWMFAVYDDGVVVSVDYYEGFAEIAFNVEV
jgi:hypothetical protein